MTRSLQRGQPVIAFAGLLLGWAAVRLVAVAAAPTPAPLFPSAQAIAAPVAATTGTQKTEGKRTVSAGTLESAVTAVPAPMRLTVPPQFSPLAANLQAQPLIDPSLPFAAPPAPTSAPALAPIPGSSPAVALVGGHQLLWLAALGQLPLPAALNSALRAVPSAPQPATKRWSGDSWLLLRRGAGPAALAAIGGSYGASQAGAVLRYRLAPADPRKPALYLRGSAALNGTREQELAFGFSARLVPALPVAALAELRATRTAAGTRGRPAAALVTELPVLALPFKLSAEAYGQAGYVGGRNATPFADGQLRLERKTFATGNAELRAGAGVWAGAQKGAARVDVGPTASLRFRLTDSAGARLSADWRFRVAGDAAPGSGPALSLSAGF